MWCEWCSCNHATRFHGDRARAQPGKEEATAQRRGKLCRNGRTQRNGKEKVGFWGLSPGSVEAGRALPDRLGAGRSALHDALESGRGGVKEGRLGWLLGGFVPMRHWQARLEEGQGCGDVAAGVRERWSPGHRGAFVAADLAKERERQGFIDGQVGNRRERKEKTSFWVACSPAARDDRGGRRGRGSSTSCRSPAAEKKKLQAVVLLRPGSTRALP